MPLWKMHMVVEPPDALHCLTTLGTFECVSRGAGHSPRYDEQTKTLLWWVDLHHEAAKDIGCCEQVIRDELHRTISLHAARRAPSALRRISTATFNAIKL